MWVYKVMPLHNEVTMANRGGFIQAPMNKTRFSCRVFRNVATWICNYLSIYVLKSQ